MSQEKANKYDATLNEIKKLSQKELKDNSDESLFVRSVLKLGPEEGLRYAIIFEAARDLTTAYKKLKEDPSDQEAKSTIKEIQNFFDAPDAFSIVSGFSFPELEGLAKIFANSDKKRLKSLDSALAAVAGILVTEI